MTRTREYYLALGYDSPYQWAHYGTVPFTPLTKALSEATVSIVTTAAPYQPEKGDQGPGAPYNAAAKFYEVYAGSTATMPDLRISHVAIDRDHTTAEDIGTYFPLAALQRAAAAGQIGRIGPRFYGLPTNRSLKTTTQIDSAALVAMCLEDELEAVILVPNCPVCHQSVSLAARSLDEAGIATVIMGCARDIVSHVGVPRFLFSNFPLGNSAGRPNDPASQTQTMTLALDLLSQAIHPRSIRESPLRWTGAPNWKDDYSNAANLSTEEIIRRKQAFDVARNTAKALRGAPASKTR